MSLRAVLFDLDGTLLDTLADIAVAMNRTLQNHGLPVHPVSAYRQFVGWGSRELTRRAMGRAATEELVDLLEPETRETYAARATAQTLPYDGVAQMLQSLERIKIPFAILSNKPDDLVQIVVAELLSEYSFHAVVGHRPEAPAKPDPASALDIAQRLQVEPPEVLFLGDSDVDMITANRAGMYAVGASWGFRGARELQRAGAATIVDRPQEILPLLDGQVGS